VVVENAEDDVAHERAVEEGFDAEIFVLLGRGDDYAEVAVLVAHVDVRGVLSGDCKHWQCAQGRGSW